MKRRTVLTAGGASLFGGCMRLEQTTATDESNQSQQNQRDKKSDNSNSSDESDTGPSEGSPTISGNWLQFGNDASNTGYTTENGVTEKNHLWKQEISVGGETGGPIIVDDKVIVNEVAALDAGNGEQLWEAEFTGFRPTPAHADGLVFTGDDSALTAIDIDNGEIVWQEPFGATAITIYDNRLFVRASREVAAYDFSGQRQWHAQTPSQFRGRHEPACEDGIVCVPVYHTEGDRGDGEIIAFDTESGRQQWKYEIGAASKFAPLISESKVYFAGRSGIVRALDMSDGSLLWEKNPDIEWIPTSPAYTDGIVYVGGFDGYILGYESETGDLVFETANYQVQEYKGGMAVTDDVIYGVGNNGVLTANDRHSGELLWTHEMARVSPHEQWPALADGYVVISDGMGNVYAIEDSE